MGFIMTNSTMMDHSTPLKKTKWGNLSGLVRTHKLYQLCQKPWPTVILVPDTQSAYQLARELPFFMESRDGVSVLPQWETSAAVAMRHHHEASLQLFEELIESGVCREQARGVLPQNMYTEYYASANLNNILKFIDLRTHEGAQWEIQEMAKGMLEIITKLYPVTVGAYREVRGNI